MAPDLIQLVVDSLRVKMIAVARHFIAERVAEATELMVEAGVNPEAVKRISGLASHFVLSPEGEVEWANDAAKQIANMLEFGSQITPKVNLISRLNALLFKMVEEQLTEGLRDIFGK